jgi:cytochrome c-type biogenesis protein CcsB
MLNIFFFKLTLCVYFFGTLFFLLSLTRRGSRVQRLSLWLTAAGFGFHTLALLTRMGEAGYFPLTNLYEAISFFSWAMVLVFLVIEYRYRIHVLGSFVLPLVLISLVSAAALPTEIQSLDPVLKNAWVTVHTTLSLLGIVAFALAFVAGLMYLIEERLLKSKRLNGLYHKLPSLEILDQLNQRSILLGFPLLTLGILTGALSAEHAWGSYWAWDPKQVVTLSTWLFYLVVLHGRITIGWRAKKGAYLAVIGFIGVIFTFVGVNFWGKGPHTFI